MTRLVRNSLLLVATASLAACGLFGDDDEELEPAELIKIETKVPIKKLWSKKLGDDAEYLRVALRPAGDGAALHGQEP